MHEALLSPVLTLLTRTTCRGHSKLVDLCHFHGLNMRHLGRLRQELLRRRPNEKKEEQCAIDQWCDRIMLEVITRTLKQLLRQYMRDLNRSCNLDCDVISELDMNNLIVEFCNLVVSGRPDDTFWGQMVPGAIVSRFGHCALPGATPGGVKGKEHIQVHEGGAGGVHTADPLDPDMGRKLKAVVGRNWRKLFARLEWMMGIQMSVASIDKLVEMPDHFEFQVADVARTVACVKEFYIATQAQGMKDQLLGKGKMERAIALAHEGTGAATPVAALSEAEGGPQHGEPQDQGQRREAEEKERGEDSSRHRGLSLLIHAGRAKGVEEMAGRHQHQHQQSQGAGGVTTNGTNGTNDTNGSTRSGRGVGGNKKDGGSRDSTIQPRDLLVRALTHFEHSVKHFHKSKSAFPAGTNGINDELFYTLMAGTKCAHVLRILAVKEHAMGHAVKFLRKSKLSHRLQLGGLSRLTRRQSSSSTGTQHSGAQIRDHSHWHGIGILMLTEATMLVSEVRFGGALRAREEVRLQIVKLVAIARLGFTCSKSITGGYSALALSALRYAVQTAEKTDAALQATQSAPTEKASEWTTEVVFPLRPALTLSVRSCCHAAGSADEIAALMGMYQLTRVLHSPDWTSFTTRARVVDMLLVRVIAREACRWQTGQAGQAGQGSQQGRRGRGTQQEESGGSAGSVMMGKYAVVQTHHIYNRVQAFCSSPLKSRSNLFEDDVAPSTGW